MAERILFEPGGIASSCQPDETLLDCARRSGVAIASSCGGRGICKTCVIRYLDDTAPAPTPADEQFFSPAKLAKGWRRACQTTAAGASRIHVPARARAPAARMAADSADIWVPPDPAVRLTRVSMDAASSADSRDDASRLLDAVNDRAGARARRIDIRVLQRLSRILREQGWKVQVALRGDEVIAVLPARAKPLGLAVDLGTTSIAVMLIDLHGGNTLATRGLENPQARFGDDVVARISWIKRHPEKLSELQSLVVQAIDEAVRELCARRGLDPGAIVDAVVAGNTAMQHILLGLSVGQLAVSPFTAAARVTHDVKARDIGFGLAPGAYLHVMPVIGGFVGGDHTAMLLGIRADEERRTILALDIGTNTEISLIHEGRITSLSCPSGPALEGGNISCGMRAARGAIERITLGAEGIAFETIGQTPPLGLCGSAVLDAIACYFETGAINHRGQINAASPHAARDGDHDVIHIADGGDQAVTLTQQDVRNVQLAKGAVRAGCELLLARAGVAADRVDRIVLAGAFGLYIDVANALKLGMVPDIAPERFEQIGNAAGMGAKLALVSVPLRLQADRLALESEYVEQVGTRAFMRQFMHHINLPRGDG